MFGYVRPMVGEMKVAENELYHALYCGLCRAMGRRTGPLSRLTLRYDFVFLVAFRAALTGEALSVGRHRCVLHPLRPRAMAEDGASLAYAARAAAVLCAAKLDDDLADERGLRRAAAGAARPAVASMRRRAGAFAETEEEIRCSLSRLAALEAAGSDSIDETAACFGGALGAVFAGELSGTEEKIARAAGDAVGRFLYVIDAADDAADDAARGRYNPILRRYGPDCLAVRPAADAAGRIGSRQRLTVPLAESLYTAAMHELSRLAAAEALIDYDGVPREIAGIVKNIVYLGLPAQLRRVLALPEHPLEEAKESS